VSNNHPSVSLPKSAINEFEKMGAKDWGGGVSLDELLRRVNRVASKLRSIPQDRDSRVSVTFQERSFRHYQTLGCIASGEREGRRVVYGLRHFTQALLIRRLLLEKVSAERIAGVMANRSAEEMKRMFLEGLEMVIPEEEPSIVPDDSISEEIWRCIRLIPGVELQMRDDLPKIEPDDLQKLRVVIEDLL